MPLRRKDLHPRGPDHGSFEAITGLEGSADRVVRLARCERNHGHRFMQRRVEGQADRIDPVKSEQFKIRPKKPEE